MRYPIYFFLLLSGFFYLTGKPLDNNTDKTLISGQQSAEQTLAYARKIRAKTVATKSSSQPVAAVDRPSARSAKTIKPAQKQPSSKGTAARDTVLAALDDAPVANVKRFDMRRAGELQKTAIASEAVVAPTTMQSKWRTSALQPALGSIPSGFSKTSSTVDPAVRKPGKTSRKKTLDWRVFGSDRRNVAYGGNRQKSLARRIPQEAVEEEKEVRKSRRTTRRAKVHKRRANRARRAARKSTRRSAKRRAKRKRAYRVARSRARARRAHRIASRHKARKKSRSRRKVRRSRRKKFGFVNVAGTFRLFGD